MRISRSGIRTARRVTKELHDNAGYTPYEGRELTGWPVVVISRGDVIVEDGKLHAERGRGQFVSAVLSDWARPRGVLLPELGRLRTLGLALEL